MRLKTMGALAVATLLCGCVELTSGLVMLSDSMELENGSWWDDEHHQESIGTDYCPGLMEFGRVNNQTYARLRNYADTPMSATLTWSTGLESSFYLQPGETSSFVYMSPSIVPSNLNTVCD